jgi:hypothetical protein
MVCRSRFRQFQPRKDLAAAGELQRSANWKYSDAVRASGRIARSDRNEAAFAHRK